VLLCWNITGGDSKFRFIWYKTWQPRSTISKCSKFMFLSNYHTCFLDLNKKATLAIFRDSHYQEITLSEEYSKTAAYKHNAVQNLHLLRTVMSVWTLRLFFEKAPILRWGKRWRSWLSHCTTSREVAGSILNGVTGICYWHNPCGLTMALGSTQPVTEMSTRNISWGRGSKGRWCLRLTTLPPSWTNFLEIWVSQPPGTMSCL
jgi:hypothetical protein